MSGQCSTGGHEVLRGTVVGNNSRTKGIPKEGLPELGFHGVGVWQGRTKEAKAGWTKERVSSGQTGKLGQG